MTAEQASADVHALIELALAPSDAEREQLGALGAPDLLRAAARLIDRSMAQLDLRKTGCPHCGAARYENQRDARTAEKLSAQAESLRRAAGRLAGEE
jgi:hypothetical protein